MLLETLDIKKNDVLIFSENTFDFNNNFKVIFKQGESKKPIPINFTEIEKYIQNSLPKNIILYRLLTNFPSFNPSGIKYGIKIWINDSPELIYYDPAYIIKDLEELQGIIDFETFRFKIQQVGLTLLSTKDNPNNYSEVYAFDLSADEARNQNDKVYAEAIFALDKTVFENDLPEDKKESDTIRKAKVNKYEIIDNLEESEDILKSKELPEEKFNEQDMVDIEPKILINEIVPETEVYPEKVTSGEEQNINVSKPSENEKIHSELKRDHTFQFSEDAESEPVDMKKVLTEVLDLIPQKSFLDKLIKMQGPNHFLKKTMERAINQKTKPDKKELIKSISETLNKQQTNIQDVPEPANEINKEELSEPKQKSITEFLKKHKESDSLDEKPTEKETIKSEVLNLFKSVKDSDYLNHRMSERYTFKADQK